MILVGREKPHDPPDLAAMRWWTSRGPRESFKRDEQGTLLLQLALPWGRWVLHVFDQGFASSFWLGLLFAFSLRFVLRWKKEYHLVDAQGNRRAAWKIARGKRGWQERTVWDCRHHQWVQASILALAVHHPDYPELPLWLVIARRKGGLPWYLPDLRADHLRPRCLGAHVCLCAELPDRIDLAGKQERVGIPESACVELGTERETSLGFRAWPMLACSRCSRPATRRCGAFFCAAIAIAQADTLAPPTPPSPVYVWP